MCRSQSGGIRFSLLGRRSGIARHALFACLAPGSGTAEEVQSWESVVSVKYSVNGGECVVVKLFCNICGKKNLPAFLPPARNLGTGCGAMYLSLGALCFEGGSCTRCRNGGAHGYKWHRRIPPLSGTSAPPS